MSEWLERKYINLVGSSLRNFKQKSPYLFVASCPLCGDSQRNKFKARGYFYTKKDQFFYKCFNCGESMTLLRFLKEVSYPLWVDIQREMLEEGDPRASQRVGEIYHTEQEVSATSEAPRFDTDFVLSRMQSVDKLPTTHPARMFVSDRSIPTAFWKKLYYQPKFFEWSNQLKPGSFPNSDGRDEPRLIIPFRGPDEHLFGYQGRSLDPNSSGRTRYYTVMLDHTSPPIYGLDTLDKNSRAYAFEGPFDSMFILNSVAALGGVIQRDLPSLGMSMDMLTIVYDNEKHNADVVKNLRRAANRGYRVCVWPSDVVDKDVNDMVRTRMRLTGESVSQASLYVKGVIDENTFEGMEAQFLIEEWDRS
jgi:hypothetical protein